MCKALVAARGDRTGLFLPTAGQASAAVQPDFNYILKNISVKGDSLSFVLKDFDYLIFKDAPFDTFVLHSR